MKRSNIKRLAKARIKLKKMRRWAIIGLETILCLICYSFVSFIILTILYYTIKLVNENEAFRWYILGILTIIATVLSIMYIKEYNKKYRKNDSDSSERQNYFLFETDIRREEERYFNR